MNNLQSSVQRMLDQLDSPILKVSREFQKTMSALQSPQMTAFLESNRKMQNLVSPAMTAILESNKRLRLGINPNMQAFLDQQAEIRNKLKPYHYEIAKFSDSTNMLSKWAASIETPASVFTQLSTFKKTIYTASIPFQQVQQYYQYFDRLSRQTSATDSLSTGLLDLDIFQRFDYTLIEEEEAEPETQLILLDEGSRVKRIIKEIYQYNERLFTMQPHDFEQMIAELLRYQQFEVEMTKRTRDGGYDLLAIKNIGDFPVRFLVECKRHAKSRKIGVGIVRSFRDVINTYGANKGIIVTSSYFSPDAERERSQGKPYLLDFRDHDDVINWVNTYVN
jgi:HJR/Mrr/RecB family endonuclease